METFKNKNYKIIKNAIDKEFSQYLYNYLILKANVVTNLMRDNYLPAFEEDWGTLGDYQSNIQNTYCCYSDMAIEALLLKMKSKIEKSIKIKLVPNYTYCRLYRKGSELLRHKDRFSCGISSTLNLGGDMWPIFIEPDVNSGSDGQNGQYVPGNSKGVKVKLNQGDMLIYNGIGCEHWREPFEGEKCGQVFLHYQEQTQDGINNMFDGRPSVGFPKYYRKNNINP